MSTTVKSEQKEKAAHTSNKELAAFIGELFSFNSSLKLFHWSVTGTGSYAKHMALDEAVASVLDVIDRITETTKGHCETCIRLLQLRRKTQRLIP